MTRFFAALFGLFILSTLPACALDIYTVTEAEIQHKLDEKLPLSSPTKFKGTATLLPGVIINFKANGTIEVDGAFEVRHENTNAFFRGRFAAVTNLKYANSAIYLDRTTLTDFEGNIISDTTGNIFKDGVTSLMNTTIAATLNNPGNIRDILALLLFKKLEEKPVYKLDGRKPWHALARNIISDESLIISENLLTIRTP